MFPIFVVLPFKTPGGIGMKPKIICAFRGMKELGRVFQKGKENSLSEQGLVTTFV